MRGDTSRNVFFKLMTQPITIMVISKDLSFFIL